MRKSRQAFLTAMARCRLVGDTVMIPEQCLFMHVTNKGGAMLDKKLDITLLLLLLLLLLFE